MARIPMTGGFTPIPEGTHVFRIFGVEYKEEFGKLTIYMVNAQGLVHRENYTFKNGNTINEGAMNAFSYFAKTAMKDYTLEDIDPDQLVGCYIRAEVVHDVRPSNKPNAKPGATVTFCNLGDKSEADGFDTTPVPKALTLTLADVNKPAANKAAPAAAPAAQPAPAAPAAPSGGLNLDELLG